MLHVDLRVSRTAPSSATSLVEVLYVVTSSVYCATSVSHFACWLTTEACVLQLLFYT